MTVEGYIFDKESNSPINNAVITLVDIATGKKKEPLFHLVDNSYEAWAEVPDLVAVYFDSPGHKSQIVPLNNLANSPNIYLEKGLPAAALAAAAGIMLFVAKKKKKSVGALKTSDVIPFLLIIGAVYGFNILNKILEFFGLKDSKDTKDLDYESSNPNSFWNPNYWQNINPSNTGWTYAITEATARQWCQEIYNAFGAFNDCEECVIAVFKRCKTKANASFIAWVWQKQYGQDLLTYLRGGNWPQDRLSDKDVNTINQFIAKLPDY